MKKHRFEMKLKGESYPVWVGNGILTQASALLTHALKTHSKQHLNQKKTSRPTSSPRSRSKSRNRRKIFLICDDRLKRIAQILLSSLKSYDCHVLYLNVSESAKELSKIYPIYGELLKLGADRQSILFGVGGGVVGDITGFIAGTYQRGIPWVGVPSTLLAQVDSSLGGKTGVNHAAGKNLIGVFHQPIAVLCDVSLLRSLPERERLSGLGEVLKIGLALDAAFFRRLVKNWPELLKMSSADTLVPEILKCLKWKAKLVEKDVFDRSGVRAVLNFGHTLGHAIEAETKYKVYRHGEAVILGMRCASFLSFKKGHLNPKQYLEIENFLSQLPVPGLPRNFNVLSCVKRVKLDKKSVNQKPQFILLKRIGATILDSSVTEKEMEEALESLRMGL